jgi:hypothetical protein
VAELTVSALKDGNSSHTFWRKLLPQNYNIKIILQRLLIGEIFRHKVWNFVLVVPGGNFRHKVKELYAEYF